MKDMNPLLAGLILAAIPVTIITGVISALSIPLLTAAPGALAGGAIFMPAVYTAAGVLAGLLALSKPAASAVFRTAKTDKAANTSMGAPDMDAAVTKLGQQSLRQDFNPKATDDLLEQSLVHQMTGMYAPYNPARDIVGSILPF